MITAARKVSWHQALCVLTLIVIAASGCATSSINTAIARNDRERALELVSKGQGISEKDASGRTPLHNAAAKGDSELVAALLQRGADANASSNNDVRPLHNATVASHLDVETVKLLLNHGADPNVRNTAGATPLLFAASTRYNEAKAGNHIEIVELLLRAGADPNIENIHGKTAIFFAANRGRPLKVVEMLLESGADARHRSASGGISPLIEAAHGGQREAFNLLVEAGATPHLTVNQELSERSEKNRLQVNLTFENNARTYSMYGDWLCEHGRDAESASYYQTAGAQFALATEEYNRASKAYTEEIPKAKSENVGRVAKSFLTSVFGVIMAATTGHGFVATPNLTDKAEVYEKEAEKYAKKATECDGLAENSKQLAANLQEQRHQGGDGAGEEMVSGDSKL